MVTIRPATPADVPALGRLGGQLIKTHLDFDRQRFLDPGANPDDGYGRFLRSQMRDENVVVLVAEQAGEVVGYVYAGIEPLSWKELRDACGFIHDVIVDARGRRGGVATALITAACDWLKVRGTPRVMLWTAQPNDAAQILFERLGFRKTMIEMTKEL